MANRAWQELSPRSRRLLITGGAFDAKARWALAVTLISSVGAVPIAISFGADEGPSQPQGDHPAGKGLGGGKAHPRAARNDVGVDSATAFFHT